jgi:hypothetical protein
VKPFVQVDARQDVFTMVPFLAQPVEIDNVQTLVALVKDSLEKDMRTIVGDLPVICAVNKWKRI